MIKEDGIITERTVFRIEEPNFIKSIIEEFNVKLSNIDLRIIDIDTKFNGNTGYIISPTHNKKIKLFCKYSEFAMDYGYLLYNSEAIIPLTLNNVIKMVSVYVESYPEIISRLDVLLRKKGLYLNEYEHEFNELIVYEGETKKYIILKLNEFIEKFKEIAVATKVLPAEGNEFIDFVNNPSNIRYTEKQVEERHEVREQFNKREYR